MNIIILFKRDKSPLKRLKYARLKMEDIFCDAIIVPYSYEDIENMRERKFNSLYKKIYAECKYSRVFPKLPPRLKARLEKDNARVLTGYPINVKYIRDIVMKIGSYSSNIGIYSEKITPDIVSVMYSLSEITNILYLFTYDSERAEDIAEMVFEKNGAPVNISSDILKMRNMDIIVAADVINFTLKKHTEVIDIFEKNHTGISGLYFSAPEKYLEIKDLCGADTDNSYVEFLESMGADFSEIRISGIKRSS